MSEVFKTIFDRVIGNEGRFQDDKNDRGNWTSGQIGVGKLKGTKFGISAMTYPNIDIKNMSIEQAYDIYYNDWWLKFNMHEYPSALAYQMFDAGINHGMHNTNKMLQRALGVTDDGIIGPKTLEKMFNSDPNDVLMLFLAERLEFFTNVNTWNIYSKGWARRIAHNLRYAAKDN